MASKVFFLPLTSFPPKVVAETDEATSKDDMTQLKKDQNDTLHFSGFEPCCKRFSIMQVHKFTNYKLSF